MTMPMPEKAINMPRITLPAFSQVLPFVPGSAIITPYTQSATAKISSRKIAWKGSWMTRTFTIASFRQLMINNKFCIWVIYIHLISQFVQAEWQVQADNLHTLLKFSRLRRAYYFNTICPQNGHSEKESRDYIKYYRLCQA